MFIRQFRWFLLIAASVAAFAVACGGEGAVSKVVETVLVEKIEKVVETVVVEKVVAGEVMKVVETVIVEKPVTRIEKVVETVVVETEKIVIATAAPIMSGGPQGKLVLGVDNVPPPLFVPSLGGVGLEDNYYGWGVVQFLLTHNDDGEGIGIEAGELDPSLSIAEAWEVAADLTSVTFKIREGVPFHSGGEVTAEDVVWSHNDALKEGSTFWGVGNMRNLYDRWEKVDDYTAVMHFTDFNPSWAHLLSDYGDHQPWVFSKQLVDRLGEAEANITPDGTGPYKSISWKSRESVDLEAVSPHWAFTPSVKYVSVFEIPDELARAAAFQTGEIDLAWIGNTLIRDTQQKVPGSHIESVQGPGWIHKMNFGGNYWADKEYNFDDYPVITEEALGERPGFKPDGDHAWIGDPKDPERMESARKVRLALSMAIDRQTLLDTVYAGVGKLGGSEIGVILGDLQWKSEWEVEYDPEGAKELIAAAGYPDGFPISIWNPTGNIMNTEAGDAVAQMWSQVGVDVTMNTAAYAAMRPMLFNGQMEEAMMWAGSTGNSDQPCCGAFGPTGLLYLEFPLEIQKRFFDTKAETDIQKRIAINVEVQDFISEQQLIVYFASIKDSFLVGPRVMEWLPHYKVGRYLNNIWKLKLRPA